MSLVGNKLIHVSLCTTFEVKLGRLPPDDPHITLVPLLLVVPGYRFLQQLRCLIKKRRCNSLKRINTLLPICYNTIINWIKTLIMLRSVKKLLTNLCTAFAGKVKNDQRTENAVTVTETTQWSDWPNDSHQMCSL